MRRSVDGIDPICVKIDRLITVSRLKEIEFIVNTDIAERLSKMFLVLKKLKSGGYLLGTGSSTVGIIPLTVEEVIIGRFATVLEKPTERVIDYGVTDTLYFVPREVSREHARVFRYADDSKVTYVLSDLGSTCGTYVNGEKVDPEGEGMILSHGDVISLGPSMISTYMFYLVPEHDDAP